MPSPVVDIIISSNGDAITEHNIDRDRGPPTVMAITGLCTNPEAGAAARGYVE